MAHLRRQQKKDPSKRYVLKETYVDKFFTQRVRIEIGEATCEECGYDVLKVNHLPEFESLSKVDQSAVKATLRDHLTKYHSTPSGKRVITDEEMAETSWTNPETLRP